MRDLLRTGYGRFLDSNGRVTLVGLTWFIALYGAFCAIGAAAWRAVLGSEEPGSVAALFPVGVLIFWLSPLATWIVDAVRCDAVLRLGRLKASPGVMLTWGGGLGLLLPLTHGGAGQLAQRAAIGVVSAAYAYFGLRLLDRVAVVHAALGVAGAAATGWAGARALGVVAGSVHRAHLAGQLRAVRADQLPTWIALGALATGMLITTSLHLSGRRRGRAQGRAAAADPMAPDAPRASYGAEVTDFIERAGAGAEKVACEYDRRAARARQGRDAERTVAAVLAVLAPRGWSLDASVYIEGERIGDIDFLVTGPSGCRYAIDVKAQACTVRYDTARGELVLAYGAHEENLTLLATARDQMEALERHGYGCVQPVLCFTRALIRTADVVDGVVIIDSGALLAWLQTTDAQARSTESTEFQHY